MSTKRIGIIIPVRDEADALEALLPELLRMAEGLRHQAVIPLLVVDDGSKDGSADVARKYGVESLSLPPRGKPQAVKAGFEEALRRGYDAVIVFDGDGQHPVGMLPKMIEYLAMRHIVKGSRFHELSYQDGTPLDRTILNAATRGIIRQFTGWDITDPQCGLVGLRDDMIRRLLPLLTWGEEWEMEMILRLWAEDRSPHCPIWEFPIAAHYTGLPGHKQAEKYDDRHLEERLHRLDRQSRYLYRLLKEILG